jgi:predicted DNA-binding protein YlxM (UPF0122 family)
MPDGFLLVSVAELAARLKVTRQAVWALVRRKTINPPIKVRAHFYAWHPSVAEEIICQRMEIRENRLREKLAKLEKKLNDLEKNS